MEAARGLRVRRRPRAEPRRSLLLPCMLFATLVAVVEYAVGDTERYAHELMLDRLPDRSGALAAELIREASGNRSCTGLDCASRSVNLGVEAARLQHSAGSIAAAVAMMVQSGSSPPLRRPWDSHRTSLQTRRELATTGEPGNHRVRAGEPRNVPRRVMQSTAPATSVSGSRGGSRMANFAKATAVALMASSVTAASARELKVSPEIPLIGNGLRAVEQPSTTSLTDTKTSFWKEMVKGSRMQLTVWYSAVNGSSVTSDSEDNFIREYGGIPVGTTDRFRGASIVLEGGGGINVNRTKVNMKVVEDFGAVDATCTHYYAREWLAVRLAYGEDRALRLYLRNNNTKEWSHCAMIEEVHLPPGYHIGLSSPGQIVGGDELRIEHLQVTQRHFPTRVQEVSPPEFSTYASVVGAYMALDLNEDGIVDPDFVRVFEMSDPERYALARAQRLATLGSLAPADGNHDKKLTLHEFTQYFAGKTGIKRNFDICTGEHHLLRGKGAGSHSSQPGGASKVGSVTSGLRSASAHHEKAWEEQTIEKVDQFLIVVHAVTFIVMQIAIYTSKHFKRSSDDASSKLPGKSKQGKKTSSSAKVDVKKTNQTVAQEAATLQEQKKKEQRARDLAKKAEAEAQHEEHRRQEEARKKHKLAEEKKRKDEERRKEEEREEEASAAAAVAAAKAKAWSKKKQDDLHMSSDSEPEKKQQSARDKKKEERRRIQAEQKAAEQLAEQLAKQRRAEQKAFQLIAEQKLLEEKMRIQRILQETTAVLETVKANGGRNGHKPGKVPVATDPLSNGNGTHKAKAGQDKAANKLHDGNGKHVDKGPTYADLSYMSYGEQHVLNDQLLAQPETEYENGAKTPPVQSTSQDSRRSRGSMSSQHSDILLPSPRSTVNPPLNQQPPMHGWMQEPLQRRPTQADPPTIVRAHAWDTPGASEFAELDSVWLPPREETPIPGSQWRPGTVPPSGMLADLIPDSSSEVTSTIRPAQPSMLPAVGDPFAALAANPWGHTATSDPFAGPNSLFTMGFGNDPRFTNSPPSSSPSAGVIGSGAKKDDHQQMSRLRHIWS